MTIPENIRMAINEMFQCHNLMEHLECYQYFNKQLKDCTFVVFSENEGTKLPKPLCTNYDNDFAIINIGCADRYYAVNQQIYEEMIGTGKSDFFIDLCVDLDTQAVSYLKNIFTEYNEILDYGKIKELIEYLQLPEVNYCCTPYLIENAIKKDKINTLDCYQNIKSFMLFKAFDYDSFLQNGVCKYYKQKEEIQLDTDRLFNEMLSEKFVLSYEKEYKMQESLYILLLKTICIEFANPKKSPQKKIIELFDFVNEELGFFPERELAVCYYYFKHDEKTKKFFKRIQRNSKSLLNAINGMAWDLIHIRIIEQEFTLRPENKVKFAIHVLLTFDNGLKEILQINPIEQIAFYNEIPIPKLKYRWVDKIPNAMEKMFSVESKQRRKQTFAKMNAKELKGRLEKAILETLK